MSVFGKAIVATFTAVAFPAAMFQGGIEITELGAFGAAFGVVVGSILGIFRGLERWLDRSKHGDLSPEVVRILKRIDGHMSESVELNARIAGILAQNTGAVEDVGKRLELLERRVA